MNDIYRQMEMTLADLGYAPPTPGMRLDEAYELILAALLDLQRRVNK